MAYGIQAWNKNNLELIANCNPVNMFYRADFINVRKDFSYQLNMPNGLIVVPSKTIYVIGCFKGPANISIDAGSPYEEMAGAKIDSVIYNQTSIIVNFKREMSNPFEGLWQPSEFNICFAQLR